MYLLQLKIMFYNIQEDHFMFAYLTKVAFVVQRSLNPSSIKAESLHLLLETRKCGNYKHEFLTLYSVCIVPSS